MTVHTLAFILPEMYALVKADLTTRVFFLQFRAMNDMFYINCT